MRVSTHRLPVAALLVLALAVSVHADVPSVMKFQGVLTDSGGVPLNATVNLSLTIYEDSLGVTPLWSEAHNGVSLVNGRLELECGQSNPLDHALFDGRTLYMKIRVSGQDLHPLVPITSVPYSFRSAWADTAAFSISGGASPWAGATGGIHYSAGNVGIGLDNPNRKLYIAETFDGLAFPLKIDNYDPTAGSAVGMLFSMGGGGGGGIATARGKGALVYELDNTWNRGKFHFLQNSSGNSNLPGLGDAALTIANNKYVGVGTTSPGSRLEVNGMCRITAVAWPSTGKGMELGYSPGLHKGYIQIVDRDGGPDGDLFISAEHVGIGAGYPSTMLDLQGDEPVLSLNTQNVMAGVRVEHLGSARWTWGWNAGSAYAYFYNHTGGGTTLVLQDSTGRVGIGTASPTERLEVGGTIKASGLQMTSSPGNGYVLTSDATGRGSWQPAAGFTLPYSGSASSTGSALSISNSGSGPGITGLGRTGVKGSAMYITNIPVVKGVEGIASSNGGTSYGVYGEAAHYGVYGEAGAASDTSYGVYGLSSNFNAPTSYGVYGEAQADNGIGVFGRHDRTGVYGYVGGANYGIYGRHYSGRYGILGDNNYGVIAEGGLSTRSADGYALRTEATHASGTAMFAMGGTSGYAADFRGNIRIFARDDNAFLMELGDGLDYAEGFDVSDDDVAPGTVLIIDPDHPGELTVSGGAYDTRVAGIVAGARGLGSGVRLGAGGFDLDVALAGRVYCKVDGSYGAVRPGDLLTTAPTPGHAMVVRDHARAQGAILGKAMEALSEGETGEILVLVTLQ